MKKTLIILGILFLILIGGFYAKHLILSQNITTEKKTKISSGIHSGDLIFQTSQSRQSEAIQIATGSEYSHCGIVYKKGKELFVFEAIQPVKLTPIKEWISRGKNGLYVIKRLKNADQVLTPEILDKMQIVGEQFNGKDYDLVFGWNDEKIYCSELIWKVYQRATGIEIGKLQKLGDFKLTDNTVKEKLKERYGENIPLNESVISPQAIFESELLETITPEQTEIK